jgi:hypothetical protein
MRELLPFCRCAFIEGLFADKQHIMLNSHGLVAKKTTFLRGPSHEIFRLKREYSIPTSPFPFGCLSLYIVCAGGRCWLLDVLGIAGALVTNHSYIIRLLMVFCDIEWAFTLHILTHPVAILACDVDTILVIKKC